MMNQALKDDSDRIQSHCRRRRERKLAERRRHEVCDFPYWYDHTVDDKIFPLSSQRLISLEQLELERPIDPEFVVSSHQNKTFDEGHYPGSRMIQNW
jgi:hypothetical protein